MFDALFDTNEPYEEPEVDLDAMVEQAPESSLKADPRTDEACLKVQRQSEATMARHRAKVDGEEVESVRNDRSGQTGHPAPSMFEDNFEGVSALAKTKQSPRERAKTKYNAS